MIVLGLDTSSYSTGYAVMENKKILSYGTIKPAKKLDLFDRIIFIEKEIIKNKKIEYIIIEELAMTRNMKVVKALVGLQYHLLLEFRKKEMLVLELRPNEWRKPLEIKGKKREELKQNAIEWVTNNYNLKVNDDEAEAICIAYYNNFVEME